MTALRPPSEEDVGHAIRLVNEHSPDPVPQSGVLNDWTSPRVDLARDARIGEDVYVLVEDIGDGRAWIELHGRNAGAAIEWAEARATQEGARRAFSGGWSTRSDLFAELEQHGYVRVRSSFRMEVDLGAGMREPDRPAGIDIRAMREGEERVVYDVHQETFEDTWEPMRRSFEDWAHYNLEPSRFVRALWFLACDGPEVCGVAICHPHETIPELGWVGVLGVRRKWRRRGIGHALLLHAFGAFREQGLARAGLGVDAESPTGALALYEDVGMRETQRFDIYEKSLA
jgi:ribosomal protein S18 acetylase RimI-like enzyme